MRVSLGGNITVIAQDQWYAQIRAGKAFRFGADLAASVGNYSLVELWNPAASGVTVLAHSVRASNTTGGRVESSLHNAALVTDLGAGRNMLFGGAASVALLRTAQPAAWVGTVIDYLAALNPGWQDWANNWACQIPSGLGLIIGSYAVNQGMNVSFDWIEV
jgi:hypothetical protein